MKHHYLLAILLISYSFASPAQQNSMLIGSGGGLTGMATVYKITPDGKVLKGKGIGEIKYTECAKMKKAHALNYLQSVSEQTEATPKFDHPGNLYFFIGYAENNSERKVTWGDMGNPVPESIQKLYQEINTTLNSIRFKPIK